MAYNEVKMKITLCEDCEHLHPQARNNRKEGLALCMAHPRVERSDLVFKGITDQDPPYMRCIGINGGRCPTFEPRRGN